MSGIGIALRGIGKVLGKFAKKQKTTGVETLIMRCFKEYMELGGLHKKI